MAASQFCPVLVISLKDAEARRRRIKDTLRSLEVYFQFIDAVDGRVSLDPESESCLSRVAARKALGRDMADTEFACALSHCRAYEWMLANGADGAVVLEDDAVPAPSVATLLGGNTLGQFDFVQFDYASAYIWRFVKSVKCSESGARFERMAVNSPLATGYYLSRRAARYLLDKANPVCLPADWPCDLQPLQPYLTIPRLVFSWAQSEESSYLKGARDALRCNSIDHEVSDRGLGALQKRNQWPPGFRFWRRLLCRRLPKVPD